jgi:hypothetical protein
MKACESEELFSTPWRSRTLNQSDDLLIIYVNLFSLAVSVEVVESNLTRSSREAPG